ncbi:MAG: hypothetical protein V7765_05800 [Oleispira sp.]
MVKKIFLSSILLGSLVACGSGSNSGGGEKSVSASTGILTGLVGVKYATATQSGVIGVNGEFKYLADESIILSVGNTVLGTLPVASNISVSSLFTDLPDTAKGIRTSLRMPEYSRTETRTGISPSVTQGRYNTLHKASNMMQLLLALDNDSDASNGIDITVNTALVSDLNINFDASLFEFSNSTALQSFQHSSNVSLGMEVSKPLSEVYKLLNITLSVPRRMSIPTGQYSNDQTYIYNLIGQLTDMGEQSSPTRKEHYSHTFDNTNGLLISTETTISPVEGFAGTTYAAMNINTYNDFGLLKTYIKEDFVPDDLTTVASREATINTYVDDKVFIAIKREKYDENGDGTYTNSDSERTEYNESWRKVLNKYYSGTNADDEIFKFGTTYSYTEVGDLKESNYEDLNSSGSNKTVFSEVEAAGNVERSSKLISTSQIKTNYIETFNASGQLIRQNKSMLDSSDTLTKEENIVYDYDAEGRVKSCRFDSGSQNLSITTQTFTYSDTGLVSILQSTDNDGDGAVDSEVTKSMSYGVDGEVLIDIKGKEAQYGNSEVNGIRYLVNEYKLDMYPFMEYNRTFNPFFSIESNKCSNSSGGGVVVAQ